MEDTTLGIFDQIKDSLEDLLVNATDYLPKVVAALVILVVGAVVARVISRVVKKLLGVVEKNAMVAVVLKKAKLGNFKIASLVAKVVRLAVMFVFVSAAADVIQLEVLSSTIESLVGYLPNIFAAVVVASIVHVASNLVKSVVHDSAKSAKVASYETMGKLAQGAVLLFGVPLAVAQLGLDLTIINNNITVLVSAIAAAGALAFGLGGRKVAGSMIAGKSAGGLIAVGDKLIVDDIKGEVTAMTNTAVKLKTKDGNMIVSLGRIMK